MTQIKICTKCNIEKLITEFTPDKRILSGYTSRCKPCTKKYRHNYHVKINSQNTNWKLRVPYQSKSGQLKCSDCQFELPIKNFSKCKTIKRGYAARCKDCHKKYLIGHNEYYRNTPKGRAAAKAACHKRRAKIKQVGGKYSAIQILELFNNQQGKCVYCQIDISLTMKYGYSIDHILPLQPDDLSMQGTNDISNIQLLCARCNRQKSNKHPKEFVASFNAVV